MNLYEKTWIASEAKLRFGEFVSESQTGPQLVYLRGKPVSVLLGYELWKTGLFKSGSKTIRSWLSDLNSINHDEGELEPIVRTNRRDQFGDDFE